MCALIKIAGEIIQACGGVENIIDIELVNSRLAIRVCTNIKINITALRLAGALAVVLQKSMVQIIIGKPATKLDYLLQQILSNTA